MEGHTVIEQVLGPAIFWDCTQHKAVIAFRRPAFKGEDVQLEHVLIADSLHILDVR